MLTILFYSIWGHWHKDNFEEINAQERNMWPKLHEPLRSLSGKTQVPAAPTGTAMDGLTCLGLWRGRFRDNMQSLSLLRAATVHLHWHAPQPAHVSLSGWSLEERLLQESSPKQTGCSQGSPCGVEDVRREVSIAAVWLPSPLSRPRASFLPGCLPSLADSNMLLRSALHDRGANILYTHHWFLALFFTQSVDWNNFCEAVQSQKLLYPHSCGSQELRRWMGKSRKKKE